MSDIRRAEALLLKAIVEETSDVVFVKDVEGRYILVHGNTDLNGFPAEAFLGHTDAELVPQWAPMRSLSRASSAMRPWCRLGLRSYRSRSARRRCCGRSARFWMRSQVRSREPEQKSSLRESNWPLGD